MIINGLGERSISTIAGRARNFLPSAYLWNREGEGEGKKEEDTPRELLQPGGCNLPVFVSLVRLPITVTEK